MSNHDQRYTRVRGLLLGAAGLFVVNQVHALGLGNLSVISALDEPLVAEIELTNVEPGALESLEVNLGSRDDFNLAGIPREALLRQLEFTVVTSGEPKIRINSTLPVRGTLPALPGPCDLG